MDMQYRRMPGSVIFPALVHLALIGACYGSGWWMDQPYGDSSEFNLLAEYTHNVTLTCTDDTVEDIAAQVEYWVRPDLTIMKANQEEYFKTLDGTAGWKVDDDHTMHIITVQEEHFGFYHCILYSAPDYYVVKKGLNYKGAYFGDLWDVYRMNVIIGCSAALGFLAACIAIYIVQCVFFKEDSESDEKVSDNGSINIIVADDEHGYESIRRSAADSKENNVHLRSSFGKSAKNMEQINGGYVVHAEDEDTTKL